MSAVPASPASPAPPAAPVTSALALLWALRRQVPDGAPFNTRGRAEGVVPVGDAPVHVALTGRIDDRGRRREQYWCDGARVEPAAWLRLTCPQSACPHVRAVREQWEAFRGRTRAATTGSPTGSSPAFATGARPTAPIPEPLIREVPVIVGTHRLTARPARFPCFTHCPHDAHPPLTLARAGFDLFEDGHCVGGGVVDVDGQRQPRLPTLQAAEAYVLARQLEAQVAIEAVRRAGK